MDRQRLFAFGPLVATPGALRTLVAEGAGPARLLDRRGAGDWGRLCAEDHDANDEAVRSGERILSAYDIGSTRLWVITDAETEDPRAPRLCVPATPPACYCPPNTDGSARVPPGAPAPHEAPFLEGGFVLSLPSDPPGLYVRFHTRAPKGCPPPCGRNASPA